MFKSLIALALLSTTLSGCLIDSNGERAIAGAAAGAVVADAAGVDPITGALIGGGAGALCHDAGIGLCHN